MFTYSSSSSSFVISAYLNLVMPMGCACCPIVLPLPNPNPPPFLPPCGSEPWKDSLMSCRTGPTSGAAGLALDGDMLMLLENERMMSYT